MGSDLKGGKSLPLNSKDFAETQFPLLSDYMDFRSFLADYYAYKKAMSKYSIRSYNYAVFSAAADIKSPNYLKTIIEGKRNLSGDMILRFSKALGFNKEQTDEFGALVEFTQATDPGERNVHLKRLCELRFENKLRSGEIDRKTWEKVPNWVAWVIYAMVDQEGVEFSNDGIKKLLRGKASDDEIQTALNSLIKFGELARDEKSGEIKKTHSLIDSPEDIPVALVRKLQTQLMYLGQESLFQDSPSEREFGTLTLCLTKSEFEEIRFKLRQFRKNMNKDNSIARMNKKGERVYQLNIQLFPVTDVVEKPDGRNKLSHLIKEFHLAGKEWLPAESPDSKDLDHQAASTSSSLNSTVLSTSDGKPCTASDLGGYKGKDQEEKTSGIREGRRDSGNSTLSGAQGTISTGAVASGRNLPQNSLSGGDTRVVEKSASTTGTNTLAQNLEKSHVTVNNLVQVAHDALKRLKE